MRRYMFFILLNQFICFGQDSSNFNKQINSLLRSKDIIPNTWATCNEQNSYFLNDTIHLSTRLVGYKCSEFISWNFSSKNRFTESKGHYVKGTHATFAINATTKDDNYKLKVKEKNGKTTLNIFRRRKKIQSFLILNFESITNEGSRITLLRI